MTPDLNRYTSARRTLGECAALLDLVRALHSRSPRGRIDTAPLLARVFELLRRIDPDGEDMAHTTTARELATRHLDLGAVRAETIARYEDALRWARRWQRSATAVARARASAAERAAYRRQRLRHVALRVVAAVGGLVAASIIGEVALRSHARDTFESDLRRAQGARPPPFTGACDGRDAALGEVVRPSAVPDEVYSLKPNVDTCFVGAHLTTNEDGQRAPSRYARPKPRDTYRIVVLGDSIAFGWGVRYADTFADRIRVALETSSGRRVEVINMAVPGYNTTMEVASFASEGVTYEPDCVIVMFCGNDLSVPYLMLTHAPRTLHGSYLLGAIMAWPDAHAGASDWFLTADGLLARSIPDDQAESVPAEYRHMVGLTGYRHALEALARAATSRGATVVNFADYGPVAFVASREEFVGFQERAGIVVPPFDYPEARGYWLRAGDQHPNADGHAEIARRMLAGLAAAGACLPRAATSR